MSTFIRRLWPLVLAATSAVATPPIWKLRLPEGFRASIWSDAVPGARSLAQAPDGTVFVGTRKEGVVYALRDQDQNGRAEWKRTVIEGWNQPNGVAFRDGDLYVAEVQRVHRFAAVLAALDIGETPTHEVVYPGLPRDGTHGWKVLRVGPDGKLYIPVNAPCNVCNRRLPYAAVHRMEPDGSEFEPYARGVRFSQGLDWHPTTGEMWFVDNGREHLGPDTPPDELNHAPEAGLHFGFPYLHGTDVRDFEYFRRAGRKKLVPPAQELGAHVGASGIRFYTGSNFPRRYRGHLFIAEHGSHGLAVPVGDRITWVRIRDRKALGYEVFCEGWLEGGEGGGRWGRPVDLLIRPDGALLVSDDQAGAIYRIWYEG